MNSMSNIIWMRKDNFPGDRNRLLLKHSTYGGVILGQDLIKASPVNDISILESCKQLKNLKMSRVFMYE